jgi:SAM-dependent methyltransferase
MGFRVLAVDAREENITEGRRRHPDIKFVVHDVESTAFPEVGRFDLVLCAGLLYHLENPFRAIRNLRAITEKILIIESMCAPGQSPGMELLDEGTGEDQGLDFVAFYPTEACLVKMLYRAGFAGVYRFRKLPDDPQFIDTLRRRRSRTFLVASNQPLDMRNLVVVNEPIRHAQDQLDPWSTLWSRITDWCRRKVVRARVGFARAAKALLRRDIDLKNRF